MGGETRLMLRSRSGSVEHASLGISGAQAVRGDGLKRRAGECGLAESAKSSWRRRTQRGLICWQDLER